MIKKQPHQAHKAILVAAEADASNGFHFLKMLTASSSGKQSSSVANNNKKELIRPLRCRSTSTTSATTTATTTISLFDLLNPLREVLDSVDLDLDDLDHNMNKPKQQDDCHSCSSTSSYSHVSLEIQGHDVSPLASPNMVSRPLRLAKMPPQLVRVPPLHKTSSVSFAASVEVKEIPSHRDLPPEDKSLLWDELDVATANIQRNYNEFQVDGWDWRRATEEPAFCLSPLATVYDYDDDEEEEEAELVHPATWMVQLQEHNKFANSQSHPPDWDRSSRRGRSPIKRHRKPHHVLRPHRIDFPKQRSTITGQPLLPPYNKTKAKQKTHKLHQPSRPTTSSSNNKKSSTAPPTPQKSWSVNKPKNLISSPNHPMQEVQLQHALLQHHIRHRRQQQPSIWRHHHPSKHQLPLPTQLFLPSDLDPTPAVLLPSSSSSLTTSPSPSPRHHHHHYYHGPHHHHYDHWKRYSW